MEWLAALAAALSECVMPRPCQDRWSWCQSLLKSSYAGPRVSCDNPVGSRLQVTPQKGKCAFVLYWARSSKNLTPFRPVRRSCSVLEKRGHMFAPWAIVGCGKKIQTRYPATGFSAERPGMSFCRDTRNGTQQM